MLNTMKISELKTREWEKIDLFIAFCGFEKRCLSVLNNLQLEKIDRALVFMNKDAAIEARDNLLSFSTILGDKAGVKYISLFDPIEIADSFIYAVNQYCQGIQEAHLLVDITSFTHEALLMFVAIAKQFLHDFSIEYIYSNASVYASESENESDRWLSRGIKEVRSVLGYAGDIKPSQETVLIMMVGYECERAWQVIDTISPEELIITYNDAVSSTDQTNGGANLVHATLLRDLAAYYQNPKQYVIPSNNPFETARKLGEVIEKIPANKNIIIAPMNNKLATVGAAILALEKPEIQLCYAPAIYYNTSSYSIEGDECYLFSLD